ncbi:MAG: FAD-dependent oxidoreductase [Deltaproteobacteria bacterium]|nr:FAD-dependent oxidoreductase [Deltaproteobacteria bacterium]
MQKGNGHELPRSSVSRRAHGRARKERAKSGTRSRRPECGHTETIRGRGRGRDSGSSRTDPSGRCQRTRLLPRVLGVKAVPGSGAGILAAGSQRSARRVIRCLFRRSRWLRSPRPRRPVGTRLFFAGEATSLDDPATVRGAYASGRREAARILAL